MTRLSVPSVTKDSFSIIATENDGEVSIKLSGNGDIEATPVLTAYLRQLHWDLCRLQVRAVTFDFRELYFMNSVCLKCFVSWINQVIKMDSADRYYVRFMGSSQLRWQQRSLEALQCFAPSI